jgi:hypothetical protein
MTRVDWVCLSVRQPVEERGKRQSFDRGFAPSFSAHVRWCELRAPLQSRLGGRALMVRSTAPLPFVISTERNRIPTSRCWQGPRVRLSLKRAACRSSKPRVVTGNPGERVERSAVQRSRLGNVFFDRGVMGLRPTQGDEDGSCSATTVPGSTALPFVISTEAQRVERSAVQRSRLGNVFFDRGVMGLRPTQGDEKRLLFSNRCPWKHGPPLCHLDRSAA